jgi:hypothetical protein
MPKHKWLKQQHAGLHAPYLSLKAHLPFTLYFAEDQPHVMLLP